MDEKIEGDGDDISVSMEISGNYDDVLSKLQAGTDGVGELRPVVDDFEVLLETIVGMDGGTRSAIADRLPDETTASFDAEAVVATLRVLERYDLVVLDGNTWNPGPKLRE